MMGIGKIDHCHKGRARFFDKGEVDHGPRTGR